MFLFYLVIGTLQMFFDDDDDDDVISHCFYETNNLHPATGRTASRPIVDVSLAFYRSQWC